MEKYYSVSAYSKKVNVSSMTIYNWIRNKTIDYIEFEIGNGNKKGYIIVCDE